MFILDISLNQAMVHAHSVGRWIVLLLLLFAIINSLLAGTRPFIRSDNRLGLLLTIFADLMLLVGIYLYFAGDWGYKLIQRNGLSVVMKTPGLRFFAVEHMAGMLIAIILIHAGKAQARRPISDRAKHRRTMIFYLVALLIILASIPWPFREAFQTRGWY
jgi:L-asparagine transporter-like permease